MITITGLDRAAVVAALYNRAAPQGLGFLHYEPAPMTVERAQEILDQPRGNEGYFDYLQGRVMKVHLPTGATEFDERLYDRDNGQGAAASVIVALRATGTVIDPSAAAEQQRTLEAAADHARAGMAQSSGWQEGTGSPAFELGLADMAETLRPVVEQAARPHEVRPDEGDP